MRFGMHQTATIDCLINLRGRIRLILDKGEVELGPGDGVVQQVTHHGWWNGLDPCVLCAVLISTAHTP